MSNPKSIPISARVKVGSALDRYLKSRPDQTPTGALHDLAAAYEAIRPPTKTGDAS